MNKVYIFGHKNPDTDSITSSLVMEKYDKNIGLDAEAVRIGNVNKETQYVLNYLKIEEPRLIEKVEAGQEVVLVDHNEFSQSVENIENAKITEVVDHHRIDNFKTDAPIYYTAKPVGCTGTVLYGKFIEAGMQIEKKEAILMISAIISDTLLFKSPICTKEDIDVANKLNKIAQIDINTYGIEMLKAGTDLKDYSAKELTKLDAKETMLKDIKAVIAQVNTVDISEIMERKQEIEKAMLEEIATKGLDIMFFAITDIINSNTQAIVLGEKAIVAQKAYGKKLEENTMFLEGVVSRKKQIIPVLTENV